MVWAKFFPDETFIRRNAAIVSPNADDNLENETRRQACGVCSERKEGEHKKQA
jgi:hypothetical protein